MKDKTVTIAEIRAAHSARAEYERYLIVNRYFFRPLSYGLTWLALRFSLSSEAVSWLSGAAALTGFCLLLSPGGPALWPGIAFLMLFNFLDCVDGDVSRVMRTRNPYGKFLDSIMGWADMLFWTVVGITAWRLPELRMAGAAWDLDPRGWVAAGLLCAFFASYYTSLEVIFDQVLRPYWEPLTAKGGEIPSSSPLKGKSGPAFWGRVLVSNIRVRETQYLLLAAACLTGCVDLLLVFFLIFNGFFTLTLLFTYCRRGKMVFESGAGREFAGK